MLTTFLAYFGTFVLFATGVTMVAEFINDLFKIPSKPDAKISPKQIVSWVVAIAGACLGYALQLGFFADFGTVNQWQGWVMTAATGFGAGLAANGIYDINVIYEALKFIFQFLKPQTKVINE